ncbi:hypothetical protein MEP401_gp58 [Methylophilales phage MEP401]|nr:hypothetical protein MEP401_gp58 [Methylophilales phage MEP401]
MTIQYGEFKSYNDTDLIRDLETGTDIRITEAGDTRITGIVLVNAGISSMTAEGTKSNFLSTMYVKYLGAWKNSQPYVKHLGSWKIPTEIYKKVGTTWTRVK